MTPLRVGLGRALPPFTGGLDVELCEAIAARLGTSARFHELGDEVVDALGRGDVDCAAGGLVATQDADVDFGAPYLLTSCALAVNAGRLPGIASVDGLTGAIVGVRRDGPGRPIAERLVADGRAGSMRPYPDLAAAAADLGTGACDAVVDLQPVLIEAARTLPDVDVVAGRLARAAVALAVRSDDPAPAQRLAEAQAALEEDGTLARLRRRWLGNPYLDHGLSRH
ncbi:transporter substrate-binding domain-containing protein [Mycolicibacterium grossiae]|nr:transporter substrate-binding domain-containing protein [Mycolicibacterium grossiae]QEM46457.1 transporter substrate-binding domain-containing protein [Mycolicibacterium grossiae]